jgi:hypothetical protein
MHPLTQTLYHDMFHLPLPLAENIIRPVMVYLCLRSGTEGHVLRKGEEAFQRRRGAWHVDGRSPDAVARCEGPAAGVLARR